MDQAEEHSNGSRALPPSIPTPSIPVLNPTSADKSLRAAAYLIDIVPAFLISLFGVIPVLGAILAGLLMAPYWLLRDVTSASPGKLLLGLRVVSKDGKPPAKGKLVLRNLLLSIGPGILIIPLLGMFVGPVVGFIVIVLETIFLLTQGERLGDRWAGTVVVKKYARP